MTTLRWPALSLLLLGCSSELPGEGPSDTQEARAPIYFNVFHHQEAVGSVSDDFERYETFRQEVLDEIALYERLGIVSDQYFSDFVADIAIHKEGLNPSLFGAFRESNQVLGYHFHPTTWDIAIRLDEIQDLEFFDAVEEYMHWEGAYYDWTPCQDVHPPMFCGELDATREGGIAFMEQGFGGAGGKRACVENFTIYNAPVGLALRELYPGLTVGVTGNVHTYHLTGLLSELWKVDSLFSTDRYTYVYRLMGHIFVRGHSGAHIEHTTPLVALQQLLEVLPRDVPHLFLVHVSGPDPQLEENLLYIQEFISQNPGSRFISASEIPSLVIENPRTFSMADLEEAALYLLRNWSGRPPGYVEYSGGFISLASLFQALVLAIQDHEREQSWSETVTVDDFILPPLGLPEELPMATDPDLYIPVPRDKLMAAVMQIIPGAPIPYTVQLDIILRPEVGRVTANAAEFLNAMATLFLAERQGWTADDIQVLKGFIVPLSNLPNECSCDSCRASQDGQSCELMDLESQTHLQWYNALQLWTLEPLNLALDIP